jgi:hypothetical protein
MARRWKPLPEPPATSRVLNCWLTHRQQDAALVNRDVAEPIVVCPGDQFASRVTGDGQWVLYAEGGEGVATLARGTATADTGPAGPDRIRVMRMPLSGGRAHVLSTVEIDLQCSARSECVMMEQQGSDGETLARA